MAEANSDDESPSNMEMDFDFEEFISAHQLSKGTRSTLLKKALSSAQELSSLTTKSIQAMKLSSRQSDLLHQAVIDLRQKFAERSKQQEIDAHLSCLLKKQQLQPGNKTDMAPSPPMVQSPTFDPRAILVLKSKTNKAVHITEFLPDHVKRRRVPRNLRMNQSASNDITFTQEQDITYAGLSIDEWGAANCRLLNFLLASGKLLRSDIEYYLAYTAQIYDFASKYSWSSILLFDQQYREIQAHNNFPWGTFAPQLELQLLQPKSVAIDARRLPVDSAEDCRLFKTKGICPFGTKCKYRHVRPTKQGTVDGIDPHLGQPGSGPKNG
jgi:hypothetical protein